MAVKHEWSSKTETFALVPYASRRSLRVRTTSQRMFTQRVISICSSA